MVVGSVIDLRSGGLLILLRSEGLTSLGSGIWRRERGREWQGVI